MQHLILFTERKNQDNRERQLYIAELLIATADKLFSGFNSEALAAWQDNDPEYLKAQADLDAARETLNNTTNVFTSLSQKVMSVPDGTKIPISQELLDACSAYTDAFDAHLAACQQITQAQRAMHNKAVMTPSMFLQGRYRDDPRLYVAARILARVKRDIDKEIWDCTVADGDKWYIETNRLGSESLCRTHTESTMPL